ncbi:MAG TPA: SulP family inorganic anion transporter, partial [Polyangiaceae bacterium]|nr:SulP family inorganic anion transporter [Polyangiaceae bacterium]
KLIGYFKGGYIPDGRTVLLGGVVVLTMLVTPKKVSTRFPSSLLGLILATFINWAAGWSVASIGQIPQTLWLSERLSFVSLASHDWTDFVAPALTIAALGAIESLLCGAVASNMTGIRLQANQELIGQGVGNILIPFFGGVPATAAIARTSVGIKSGGHTRMVSLVHAVGLLLSMFLLAPVMARIPLAALAGVLMVTAVRMNEWYAIRFLFGKRFKTGMATYALTLLATVALDLTQAILIGTLVSAAVFLNQLSSLDIHIQEIIPEKLRQRGIQAVGDCAHVRVAFITGPLFFAATDKFNEAFKELNEMHALILSMRGVSNIDVSGLEAMRDLLHRLRKQGGTLMISGIHENARKTLERGGFLDDVGQDNIFWSSDQAIVEAERRGCLYCQAGAKPDGDGTAGLGEMNITS